MFGEFDQQLVSRLCFRLITPSLDFLVLLDQAQRTTTTGRSLNPMLKCSLNSSILYRHIKSLLSCSEEYQQDNKQQEKHRIHPLQILVAHHLLGLHIIDIDHEE